MWPRKLGNTSLFLTDLISTSYTLFKVPIIGDSKTGLATTLFSVSLKN